MPTATRTATRIQDMDDLTGPPVDGQALLWHAGSSRHVYGAAGVSAHSGLSGLTSGDDHTQYIHNTPTTTARNTITAATAYGPVPLTLQTTPDDVNGLAFVIKNQFYGAYLTVAVAGSAVHLYTSTANAFLFSGVGGGIQPITMNVNSVSTERVLIATVDAASKGLTVKGAASQSANLQEWQSSTSTVDGTVTENGYFTTRKNAAPADAELSAGEAAWWFDSSNGASKLMVKAKSADGTVVAGELPLA